MRTYLLAAACLALASCAAQKALPQYTEAEKEAQRHSISYWQPDTAKPVTPPHAEPRMKPNFLQRLFPSKQQVAGNQVAVMGQPVPYHAQPVPKKCKGCVFNTVAGNQTNAAKKAQVLGDGASVKGDTKAKGNAAVSQDSSTQNALTGAGNQSATKGNNTATTQTKQDTTKEASDWKAELAKPSGKVIAGVLTLVLVGGCVYLIAAYKRRKALQA
jgi:hypothetical protein